MVSLIRTMSPKLAVYFFKGSPKLSFFLIQSSKDNLLYTVEPKDQLEVELFSWKTIFDKDLIVDIYLVLLGCGLP